MSSPRTPINGSNADNAAASASAWHYIYIDDTAVATNASPELVAACFLNSTTAPTFSATKHGWYNGADRCIFAVLTDGSNNIYEFFHDGGDYCFFADAKTEASAVTPSNTWTDVNCASSVPGFSTKAFFSIMMVRAATSTTLELRTNGQSGTVGHRVGSVSETAAISNNDTMVLMDSSQIFEVKTADASANEVTVYTNGWFFPVGM